MSERERPFVVGGREQEDLSLPIHSDRALADGVEDRLGNIALRWVVALG